jgi:lipid-binding SYLF domain-containing protein
MRIHLVAVGLRLAGAAAHGQPGPSQDPSTNDRVQDAAKVVRTMMTGPASVPPAVLRSCRGVAIFPNLIKAGFLVGGKHGNGVFVARDTRAADWSNPVFLSLSGASVGAQVGVQTSEIVLLFVDQRAIDRLLSGSFTLGADVSAAAGPTSVGHEPQPGAEIFVYARSKGLFAGVALSGAGVTVDADANSAFYGRTGLSPAQIINAAAKNLQPPAAVADLRRALTDATKMTTPKR